MARKNKNDEMLEIVKKLQEELNLLKQENTSLKGKDNAKDPFDFNRLVTVIHMDDLVDGLFTIVKGDSEYKFTKIGDKQRIRLGELEKIMTTYKRFFQMGLLAIAEDDVNDYFGIDAINLVPIDSYKNIIKLSPEELGKLFNSVCASHKNMILRHWILRCKDGDMNYKDLNKLSILNQLSGGMLQQLISNISTM